jgi:hypothetical protein
MQVVAGLPFTVTILDGYPLSGVVGARVEVPVTREIVSYWVPATLSQVSVDSVPDPDPNPGDYERAALARTGLFSYGDTGEDNEWSAVMDYVPSPGDYLVVWTDDAGSWEVFVPITVVAPTAQIGPVVDFPVPDMTQCTPDVDDVGALERTRTTDAGGTTQGTFTSQTTPPDSVVTGYIQDAVDEIMPQLPATFPTTYYSNVKRALALQAALFVESIDYPESNPPNVARIENTLAKLITSLNARIQVDYDEAYNAGNAATGPVLV